MSSDPVTRDRLTAWGFRRLSDVWLPCPAEDRRNYFERWYHAGWNFTTVVGWPDRDPLSMTEEDFLATVQAYLLEDTERTGRWPWDDVPAHG